MDYYQTETAIIKELGNTMGSIIADDVLALVGHIQQADQVFFVGVGRVLLSLEAIAKRLAHLGIKAYIVGQITEPAITGNDLLIVGSGSGESMFPLGIAKKARSFGATVAHIGSNPDSTMRGYTDVFVRIPVQTKLDRQDEVRSIQPMTSLFEQALLLLGDTIALMIVHDRNIDMHNLWKFHANLE